MYYRKLSSSLTIAGVAMIILAIAELLCTLLPKTPYALQLVIYLGSASTLFLGALLLYGGYFVRTRLKQIISNSFRANTQSNRAL
jgi:hypothetical protein